MSEEVTIVVSDAYADMLEDVREAVGDDATRQQIEDTIHQMYQQTQRSGDAQKFVIEEPDER